MKLTVYMAVSADGLITRGDTDSSWVSKTDWEQLHSYINDSDAIIMGRKTMEQIEKIFPIKGPVNIVLSNSTELHRETDSFIILSARPQEVISLAKKKNLNNLLLIGGSETNKQFIKAGLVDEIVLSVHPLLIGNGLHLFGGEPLDVKLELVNTKSINNELVQIVYKVMR